MRATFGPILSCLFALCACVASVPLHAADIAGEIRTIDGDVSIQAPGASGWTAAPVGQVIRAGDTLRTGPASRAAVLCADESLLRLGENTVMTFTGVAASSRLGLAPASTSRQSSYDLTQGRIWMRNNVETFPFEVTTPAVTAAVRGTEFVITVTNMGNSDIALLHGRLEVFNAHGAVQLGAGDQALAQPGQAPRKQTLLRPEDAVQWVLHYPQPAVVRSLLLTALDPATANSPAIRTYDAGQLEADTSLPPLGAPDWAQRYNAQGFLALRAGRADEALSLFERVLRQSKDTLAAIGRSLALVDRGEPGRAHILSEATLSTARPTAELLYARASLALMAEQPDRARQLLEQGLRLEPAHAGCHSLLARIALAANRKDEARSEALAALRTAPDAPHALISAGLTEIAFFELRQAERSMSRAAERDPDLVEPLLYLARLQTGADRLAEARRTLNRALTIAPSDAAVQAMHGFILLAMREHGAAREAFTQAIRFDPGQGDAHLGLGLCAYAHGDTSEGLREVLTATLLEPRVSQFQAALGKALYQSRAFAKALDALDYAEQLDPGDPTPHLYKGIMLTDLNRPGEAIREINTSIAKNDNRAVFRSTLMLDRDLAVRNTDLAKSYSLLGLGEWSYSKAVTATKHDPLNPSAHLFLSSAFAATRQRTSAGGSELLAFRLLSPANQNAFSTFDYTPMFESPYARVATAATGGQWSNSNVFGNANLEVYGGNPGLAVDAYASTGADQGLRQDNADQHPSMIYGLVKWEPSISDAMFGAITGADTTAGDTASLNDWTYSNSHNRQQHFQTRYGEAGYTRRFSPESTFILYGRQSFNSWHVSDASYDPAWWNFGGYPVAELIQNTRDTSLPSTNLQIQQRLTWNRHSLVAGVDWFQGRLHYDYDERDSYWWLLDDGPWFIDASTLRNHYAASHDGLNAYIQDYWKISDELIVELGLSAEHIRASRYGWSTPVERNLLGARCGINWQIDADDVLRLGLQRYLNSSLSTHTSLQPADVAGFPSWINADDGTTVEEAGLAWERQWNDATFTVLRFNALSSNNPQYDATSTDNDVKDVTVRRMQVQASLNRLLTPALGLWSSAAWKRLLPNNFAVEFSPAEDFSEADLGLGLNYLAENGVGASCNGVLIHQHFCRDEARALNGDSLRDTTFPVFNAACFYNLPDKRGRLSLEFRNLLDRHFTYELEMVALDAIYPARQVVLGLSLYF